MAGISAEEYAEWLTPDEALNLLPSHWEMTSKQSAILTRLATGLIRAVAFQSKIKDRNGVRDERYPVIGSHLWGDNWNTLAGNFWTAGDVTFTQGSWVEDLARVNNGQPEVQHPEATFIGARLHSGDFAIAFDLVPVIKRKRAFQRDVPTRGSAPVIVTSKTVETAKPAATPENEEPPENIDKKPLPKALLESWAKLFNDANPNASEAEARKAVDAMFPRHAVTVRGLRQVLPPRKAGRRLKNQEE